MTHSPAPPQLRAIHRQLRFATLRVVVALMLRELGATYGRRPGGFLWMFIEPVVGVALLALIFTSVGFRTPALGTNFAIFYATGLMPYYMAMKLSSRMGSALTASRALLAYPRVTLIDVLAAKLILHTLIQLVVTAIILTGLRAYYDTGTQLLLDRVMLGLAMAAVLGAGVGVMNCFLATRFVLYQTFWSLVTRPMMFVSGIFFLIDRLPPRWQTIFAWNPLVHVVSEVRAGFYHGYDPPYIDPVWVFGIGVTLGAVGLLFLWRYYRENLEV
jgi:capsular polysaccharide transport system permease protein